MLPASGSRGLRENIARQQIDRGDFLALLPCVRIELRDLIACVADKSLRRRLWHAGHGAHGNETMPERMEAPE